MPSYAITGASRGIGLAFIEKLSQDSSNTVFALVRNLTSSPELTQLAAAHPNVHILKADITSTAELAAAAESVAKVTGGTLDVLVENAAFVMGDTAANNMLDFVGDEEKTKLFENDATISFNVNAMSVVHCTNAFLPLIRKGEQKKIIVISTGIADIELNVAAELETSIAYCVSKAAVNMIVAKYAIPLKKEGVTIVSMSPGMVTTRTGDWADAMYEQLTAMWRKVKPDYEGPHSPERSVTLMLGTFDKLTVEDNGRFMSEYGSKDWL